MSKTSAWYIRSSKFEGVKGPFPAGQISQEILLGRYLPDDEVSHDKEEWVKIRSVAELLPDILRQDRNDPQFKNRLAAAQRWADERRGVTKIDQSAERRAGESYESEEIKRLHRLAQSTKKKSNPLVTFAQFTFVILAIALVITLAFQYSPKDKTKVDCTAEAKQGVDWSSCNLSGSQLLKVNLVAANLTGTNLQAANLLASDLSLATLKYAELQLANLKYVNFTKANLKAANLTGADLSNASFVQADLSYANLRDANITNTHFEKARMDNVIWVDGRTCRVGSVGACD